MAKCSGVCPCSKRDMRRSSASGFCFDQLLDQVQVAHARSPRRCDGARRARRRSATAWPSRSTIRVGRRGAGRRRPADDVELVHVAEAVHVAAGIEQRAHDLEVPAARRPSAAGRCCRRLRARSDRRRARAAAARRPRVRLARRRAGRSSPDAPAVATRDQAGSASSRPRTASTSPAAQAAKKRSRVPLPAAASTSAFSARQLEKPWSRATASSAVASLRARGPSAAAPAADPSPASSGTRATRVRGVSSLDMTLPSVGARRPRLSGWKSGSSDY